MTNASYSMISVYSVRNKIRHTKERLMNTPRLFL
jgi:hypothetical protein